MRDKIYRPDEPKKEDLLKVYKVIRNLIKDDNCYYINNDTRLRGKVKL